MRIRSKTCGSIFVLLLVVCAGSTTAQKLPTSVSDAKGPEYPEMLAKLKGGDTFIDYRALRMAFAETKNARADADPEIRKSMFAAYNNKKYKEAIEAADKILNVSYVNIEAHGVESMAYRALGDTANADFHKEIFQGLVNSIVTGRDGKTPENAFVVISTQEEFIVMRALGYTVGSQALLSERGHKYDVLSGTDQRTNQPIKLYFNTDIQWAAELKK